jgi:tetratricopeptide (TPR) repeat protein
MIRTPRPYAFPAEKVQGTYRIVVLGESAAFGDPDPAYGFSRYLEVMLREQFPGVKFEVINTGITAINSHVVLPIARDLARHQTDLFIIYAGNNEVVGPFGPGTVFTSSAMSLPVIRATIFMRETRLGQLVDRAMQPKQKQRQDWRGMEMFLGHQISEDSPLMAPTYRNFEANIRDMVSAARRSGAKVMVSTIGTNLRDCAPFGSEHSKDLKPEALARWDEIGRQAVWLESTGAYAEALKLYEADAEIDPKFAELQFRIARCLWMLGDYNRARQSFVRAQNLDTLRFRADSKMNDILRSVASQSGPDVTLLDASALFDKESVNGVPGSDLFFDHVHMNPHGNYLLAEAMFRQVVNSLPADLKKSASAGEVASEAECDRVLALTRYDRGRLAAEMVQRMQRPPFTNQINHQEQILALVAAGQGQQESFEETNAEYQQAIAQSPNDHLLHLKYGLFLGNRDRTAAYEEFRRSRVYDDVPFVAPDGTLIQ